MNEFSPVNDFVICNVPDAPIEHGEFEEYTVAKASHPFDGTESDGSEAACGTLALFKGARIVADPCDTREIVLDGERMLVIRADDIVGVVTHKPDPRPIAPVLDMAAYRDALRKAMAEMPDWRQCQPAARAITPGLLYSYLLH